MPRINGPHWSVYRSPYLNNGERDYAIASPGASIPFDWDHVSDHPTKEAATEAGHDCQDSDELLASLYDTTDCLGNRY